MYIVIHVFIMCVISMICLQVELIEVKRHLETRNPNVMNLLTCGLIKERPVTPDEPMDGYEDPVYDPEAWNHVPDDFKDYTLEKLVHNRLELEHFKQFLAEKVGVEGAAICIILYTI